MKFGNWEVTDQEIRFAVGALNRFVVPIDSMLEIGDNDEGERMYKWLLLALEEDFLTDDDLYDFNFAFVYAAAKQRGQFEYALFDKTAAYQFEQLDEEEENQPSLGDLTIEDADAEQQRKDAMSGRD